MRQRQLVVLVGRRAMLGAASVAVAPGEAVAVGGVVAVGLFGYVVLRFPNERVLTDPGGATEEILAALRAAGV